MSIPKYAGKVSGSTLSEIPKAEWRAEDGPADKATLYHFSDEGFRYDCLWYPSEEKRLFVLFCGDAIRSKYTLPVFNRWTWAPSFPGNCLYISDPSLYLEDTLGLAWYSGTKDYDPMPIIGRMASGIAESLGVAQDNIYSYGSSGGGFAALRFITTIPNSKAIAINPQTCVTSYHKGSVEKYLRICYGHTGRAEALAAYPKRLSIIENLDALGDRQILLAQNVQDTHHYEEHYKPLCEAMGVSHEHAPYNGPVHRLLFSNPEGHNAAESQSVFDTIMKLVRADFA
ncbi:hypothetical protein GCM10007094_33680 [Pseudovibrio japonicus]|uniref:Uncharacterized protein n=1 Tax=Pseudovibrio japonicus TaxID=366534 RepID=A0ABQ3EIU8_9HYPH|nr:hypothetical protein [Pseudovibrio japonicus]GHB41501.1 hypothetical protein GCM10007094_33680 [Pseudovibrio japonicus]